MKNINSSFSTGISQTTKCLFGILLFIVLVASAQADLSSDLQDIADGLVDQGSPGARREPNGRRRADPLRLIVRSECSLRVLGAGDRGTPPPLLCKGGFYLAH